MKQGKTLIALNNYISSGGKDSVADYLVEKHGFKKYALSEGIYRIAYEIFKMPEGQKPPRKLLHHIGESLRKYNPTLWIETTLQKIEEEGHDKVVITDVRKGLEHYYLKEKGFKNVKIYCDINIAMERMKKRDGATADVSKAIHNTTLESELRELAMPFIDNSGDWSDTVEQIEKFLEIL